MEERYKKTKTAASAGIIINTFLVIIKLITGFSTKSQSMIADGLNSAGDVFASVITYIGNLISSKPKDLEHPYGHGKAEYIFSMIISFSLFFVAYNIFKSSINSIIKKETYIFSWTLIITALVTIISKIILFIYCNKIGKKYNNLLVIANAEDHRNDVIVTSSVLLSIIFTQIGFTWFDGVVGIGIACWITISGFKIFLDAYNVLMDKSVNPKVEEHIVYEIEKFDGVYHVDSITSKPVGLHYLLIIKVSVNGNMTVFQSHKIASKIKYHLKDLTSVYDVIVHINPH